MNNDIHPKGIFNDSRITDHGFGTTSEKKTLYLWVRFETPLVEDHGDLVGRFYMSPKSIEHTVEKIKSMGFKGESLEELKDGEALKDQLVQVTVEHDTYNDKIRPQIAFVDPNHSTGGMTHDDAAAASAKQFDALWRTTKAKAADGAPF